VSEVAEQGGKEFAAQGDVSKSGDVKQLFVRRSRSRRRSFTASTTRMY
jgi:hypothetical protein